MASDSLTAPVITGLVSGIAFLVFFALIFTPMIASLNSQQDILPFPQMVMIDDNGSQYAGNITTFSWGRDSLSIWNVSDSLGYAENGEATISLERGAIVNFIVRDYHDGNSTSMAHRLPVTVYVYHYPSNGFEGMFEEIDGTNKNQSSFVVDMIDEGDYYLRVNHKNPENGDGSISYYFKVRIT